MGLFDGDEQRREDDTESDEWEVEEPSESPHPDPATRDDDGDPLADLDTVTLHEGSPNGAIKRAVDTEAGVVLYAYKNGRAGGLSAVPLAETDLEAEDVE